MTKSVSISRSKEVPESMDFRFLFEEAIKYAQQFSGDIWTDYNVHDPGVTLLEYLCYAITDLGYRTNFPIEDLLYAKSRSKDVPQKDALFSPTDILPCAPLTVKDYRKLVIDHQKINNAWVMPLQDSLYQGLYTIKLQVDQEDPNDPDHVRLIQEVRTCLSANRNLGEDFANVSVLRHQSFGVSGEIILEMDALAESVLASILVQIEHFLIPRPRYIGLEALKQENTAIDDLYDGPLLRHGFLLDKELQDLPSVIHLSQIKDLILGVDGVQGVRNLVASIDEVPVYSDEIEIPENTYLRMNPEMIIGKNAHTPIQLIRNGFKTSFNQRQVMQVYHSIIARYLKQYDLEVDRSETLPVSHKRLEDIKAYHSFQAYLPSFYGIGPQGLPRGSSKQRKAQARQLKGFLLLMEQFLASYLAQLAQVRDFFSIEEDNMKKGSYYSQFPFDIPDVNVVVNPSVCVDKEKDKEKCITIALQKIISEFDQAGERKNRFIDHLMARFGERFDATHLNRIAYEAGWTQEESQERLLQAKLRFLNHYPELSKQRGKGFDYLRPSWEQISENRNLSGLKHSIYRKLNIAEPTNASLTCLPTFPNFKIKRKASGDDKVKLPLKQLLAHGKKEENYYILSGAGGKKELYFHPGGKSESHFVFADKKEEKLKEIRKDLIEGLQKFDRNSLGFFVLEHILLRPQRPLGRKMRVDIKDVDEEGEVEFHFKSIQYEKPEQVAHTSNIFLLTASNQENLEIIDFNNGEKNQLLMVIKEDGHPVLVSAPLDAGTSGIKYMKRLTQLLKKKAAEGSAAIDKWFSSEAEPAFRLQVDDSFFSHRLSIVVPNWPQIFQNEDFRQIFTNLVAQHVPAHLSVAIKWLSLHEMQDFEGKYKPWLVAKQTEEDLVLLDKHAQVLITFLGEMRESQIVEPEGELPLEQKQALFKAFQKRLNKKEAGKRLLAKLKIKRSDQ